MHHFAQVAAGIGDEELDLPAELGVGVDAVPLLAVDAVVLLEHSWAASKVTENIPAPEIVQLTSKE